MIDENDSAETYLAEAERDYLRGVRVPEGVSIHLTCISCPEQYDVKFDGRMIGYIRFRHGRLTAEYPDCGGDVVYRQDWHDDTYRSEWDTQTDRAESLSFIIELLCRTHIDMQVKP